MAKGFPQFTQNARKGERGVDIVSRIVHEQLRWLFKRNHQEHDFGIDGQIEVVTDADAVTGQLLAVQIKYGKSFFQEKNKWGYVYRGELKHFNYLTNYPIPTIIVICHPEDDICYWAKFDPSQAEVSEGGWKLTVPFDNRLNEAKPRLEEILPPLKDSLSELEEYWRLNQLFMESPYIYFIIDRSEVTSLDPTRLREFIDRLRSTKQLAFHCQGKVEISFHGYDDDRRELFEIQEVRAYASVLCQTVPELLFFIKTGKPADGLRALALCQSEAEFSYGRSTVRVAMKVQVRSKDLGDFLDKMWPGLNEITDYLGMSEDENKAITSDVATALGIDPAPKL